MKDKDETNRLKDMKLLMTAYYEEGKNLKKAEQAVKEIIRARKKVDRELAVRARRRLDKMRAKSKRQYGNRHG